MSEIIKPEDSAFFRSWGIIQRPPRVTYSASTELDRSSVGRLPAHRWIIPAPDDWGLMDALLEIEDMSEAAPPIDWGEKQIPVLTPQIEEELARTHVLSLDIPRYIVFRVPQKS